MSESTLAQYRSEPYTDKVVLRDGSTVRLRSAGNEDIAALRSFVEHLASSDTADEGAHLPTFAADQLDTLATINDEQTFTLIGELHGRVIAVGCFMRDVEREDVAQSAFAVDPTLRGKGLGSALLDRLAEAAREHGIRWLEGDVYAANHRMLNMVAASGFEVMHRAEGGLVRVRLNLAPTTTYEQRQLERQEESVTASVRIFFQPRSVAVVGASPDPEKIGSLVLHNLITSGYTGAIYPINPHAGDIQGRASFASITDVPDAVDLVVIAVPQPHVDSVVDQCISKGVRGVLLLTAGYSETGPEGREREAALLAKLRSAGIRLIGPNCFGVINTDPDVRLNTSFSPIQPAPGRVGFMTQSGALGQAILDYARTLNIGLSNFVSVGNKADISGNDLLQFWKTDERTQVILLYLESFGNPRTFSRLAREITRDKPIICVKSGRSRAGAKAASSHTGSLAGSDEAADALFRQCGVIRTNTLEELFDVATLLSHQPLPNGRRVAILTNAGGPAIMAADACEANGLELPTFADHTTDQLQSLLPPAASVANPVDMLASGHAGQYGECLKLLLDDPNVDAVLVLFVPLKPGSSEAVARAVREAIPPDCDKPVATTFVSAQGIPPELASVPSYRFPEAAATALGHACRYAEWRRRPAGTVPTFEDIDHTRARRIVEQSRERGGGWLSPDEVSNLLGAAGIPAARSAVCADRDEAIHAAQAIGYPVALKAIGPSIIHKTEVGGVKLNIQDDNQLAAAHADLRERLGEQLTGVLVQQMIPDGVEVLIGATWDETFGHVLAYGSGGTLVELIRDVSLRIVPITDRCAREMLGEVRGSALLRGWRGSPPADANAVCDVLLRLSALLEVCPEIEEVDFNPTRAGEHSAIVIDARIRITTRWQHRPGPRPVF